MTDATATPAFASLALAPELLDNLATLEYHTMTPIQAQSLPPMLQGRDVIAQGQTGSGKTAAFGLPVLNRVIGKGHGVRALILTPTRELAIQVAQALRDYARYAESVKIATIYGGAPYGPQMRALRRGASVVVGTPGRVMDHLERGSLDLSKVEIFALDEADEMLRMGFIDAVESLMEATPDDRQVALFSATMPPPIRRVASRHLRNPIEIQVESKALSTGHIDQRWLRARFPNKVAALVRILLGEPHGTTLVFARTRADAAGVADNLNQRGFCAGSLHGDLNQSARERVLNNLRAGALDIVVATDVAARGIDVNHITHVINFDLPESTEQYVHRIGRTGRAGREGNAISLVTPGEIRRRHRMSHQLKVRIGEMQVPSVEVIKLRQKDALRERLTTTLAEPGLEEASAKLTELMVGGMTAEEIAVSALKLLSENEQIEIPPDPTPRYQNRPSRPMHQDRSMRNDRPTRNDRPMHNNNDRSMRSNDRPVRGDDHCNQVELFLPIGRSRGVRPGDLVGALANEGGISSRHIGRITITDRKSIVGMAPEAAQHLLNNLNSVQIRGVDVRISLANS